jgi:glycosyltransferase involved in cell wall biosynthesis
MVVYSYYPFDPRVRKEVRALVARGYEVDIICLRDRDEKKSEMVDGAKVCRLSLEMVKGGYLRYLFQYTISIMMAFRLLTRLYFKKRYDVIHIHSLPDFLVFVAIIPKLFGAKIVLDLHEAMPEILAARFNLETRSGLVRLAAFLEKLSCDFSDRVITVNDTIRELLERRVSHPKGFTVIMNSPDKSISEHKDVSIPGVEHTDKFLMVYVGGINRERNLEVLIRATAILKKEIPIHLAIFGYGKEDYKEQLKGLATELGLTKNVHFGDWIPHEYVLSYMNLSQVGVVSYINSPLTHVAVPNKVLEFASLGKPLVIARLGALKKLFEGAALFYEPENPQDLSRAIMTIKKDDRLAKELSSKGLEVYEGCKWDVMKERLYNLYDELILNDGMKRQQTSQMTHERR